MAITSVPIRVNEDLRPSRLVKAVMSYIQKSILTIVRIFATYKPLRFFMWTAALLMSLSYLLDLRYLYFVTIGEGHVQSVILTGALLGMGAQVGLIAFVADLIAVNRRLLEKIAYTQRQEKKCLR